MRYSRLRYSRLMNTSKVKNGEEGEPLGARRENPGRTRLRVRQLTDTTTDAVAVQPLISVTVTV